jgi:endonuclease-8
MPEGDTIHRVAAQMRQALLGRVPEEILAPQPRHRFERWPERLAGRAVLAIEPKGKHLLVRFEGDLTLHSHLRMSGAWQVCRSGERWRRSPRRAWLVLRGGGWDVVQFDGPVLELARDGRLRADPRLARLGQDVLGEGFDQASFLARLRRADPTRPIGETLLDQGTIAGIGNVWKTEACFAAGVDPWRALAEVRDEEALALVGFVREGMRDSVREGIPARPRLIYGRGGRPCPRCGTIIRSRGQGDGNRTTYWCPACQR